MSNKVLSILPVSGSKKKYFLLSTTTEDKEDGFQLILSNGESVWEGKLSADEIDKQRKKLKMDYNTYYIQTEKAFTGSDEDKNYEYQIKINQDDTADLSWKKHVTNDDIKFQLGKVILLLKDDVTTSMCSILEHCVNTNKLNTDKIHTLQTDNGRLSQERSMALKRLEKCVAAKEQMEKDLYSKFVAVLNSKKEKLRELKENKSSEVSEETPSSPPPKPSTSRAGSVRNGRTRRKKMEVDEEMSEEMNTDEEETPPPKRQRKAATSVNMSVDGDTSLVLEVEVDVPTSAVVTRPARQRAGTKKATPSKPVLPKVTRNHSNESESSMKTRMSKSSSNNSNIDAEDLFSDL